MRSSPRRSGAGTAARRLTRTSGSVATSWAHSASRSPGATGKTYGVRFADVYSTLRVRVDGKERRGLDRRTVRRDRPRGAASARGHSRQQGSDDQVPVAAPDRDPGATRASPCATTVPRPISVIERDAKRSQLAYVRKYSVVPQLVQDCDAQLGSGAAVPHQGHVRRNSAGRRQVGRFEQVREPQRSSAASADTGPYVVRAASRPPSLFQARSSAPKRSASASTIAVRSLVPSSSASVRSGDWNATANASDFLPAGIWSPR